MKKKHLFSTAMILVLLTTACASQSSTPGAGAVQSATVQESAAADSTTAAESASGEAAADSTAAAGSASDKAAAGADQNTSDPAYGTYEDPAGWYVQYEPSLFSVEKEADGARFLYTGEAVGENYVDIRYIPDREPKEVLAEKIDELIEEWELDEEEIVRDEEFIYDDKWCYSATAEFSEEAVVEWWHPDWRDIIIHGGGRYADKATGDTTSSIDRVLAQGFDGVYLDNPDSCLDSNWDAFNKYWRLHGGIPE
jgi:hypothetical protein